MLAHHHAGRRCTSTEAEHNDDRHKMGPQGVNAPAQRLSTMTATTVRAQAPRLSTTEGRRDAPPCRPMWPQGGTAGCQCTSPKAEHNDNRHSRGAPATMWHPARGPQTQPRRHRAFQPVPVRGGMGVGEKEGMNPSYGLERARSFQPGPGGLPMGRLWRASTVGGVRLPLAPR